MIRIRCCCVELGSPALLPPTLRLSHWPLWLTGISLVQYVCQWGLRLSCVPAYPWCVSLSRLHTHTKLTAALNKPVSPASIMIWCPELLSCHFSGRVIFVLRTKDNVFFFLSFCFFLRIVNSLFLLSSSSSSPPSGGDQDEEDGSRQMGEAGGRRTRVQRQTLQSKSVRSFDICPLPPHLPPPDCSPVSLLFSLLISPSLCKDQYKLLCLSVLH